MHYGCISAIEEVSTILARKVSRQFSEQLLKARVSHLFSTSRLHVLYPYD